MPEFEESDPQPNPEHNYSPSTGASKNKGGRRRSGGFKSEAVPSNQKIGEVDPTEALKTEMVKKPSQSVDSPDHQTCCSIKNQKSSGRLESAPKSEKGDPQPSKATIDSIRRVEERIAKRRTDVEKNRPEKTSCSTNNRNPRKHKKRKEDQSGLLGAIGRLFGSLFGGSSKRPSPKSQKRSYQKQTSGKNNSHRSNGKRKNNSGHKYRRGQKNHRKNASHSS